MQQEKPMWKPPAINEFIKIRELISLGLLLTFLLIITYPHDKNRVLLSLGKEKSILSNQSIDQFIEEKTKIDHLSIQKTAKEMIFLDPQNQLYWLEKFKKHSLMTGNKDELIKTYLEVFKKTNDYQIKKYLFIEIVKFYQSQESYKELKEFLSLYFREFLKDDEMAYFILKTALSLGDASFSHEVALSIKESLIK